MPPKINRLTIDILEKKISKLPKKKERSITIKELIIHLKPKLIKALHNGYTYEDLAQIIGEELKRKVSTTTVRLYLTKDTENKDTPGPIQLKEREEHKNDDNLPSNVVADSLELKEDLQAGMEMNEDSKTSPRTTQATERIKAPEASDKRTGKFQVKPDTDDL